MVSDIDKTLLDTKTDPTAKPYLTTLDQENKKKQPLTDYNHKLKKQKNNVTATLRLQFFDFECFTSQSMTASMLVEFLHEII